MPLALQVLLNYFVVQTAARPLYEANPADALSLHAAHAQSAAKPLLRAFAQALYAYVGNSVATDLVPKPEFMLRKPYLDAQVWRRIV